MIRRVNLCKFAALPLRFGVESDGWLGECAELLMKKTILVALVAIGLHILISSPLKSTTTSPEVSSTATVHAVGVNNIGTLQSLRQGDELTVTLPDYFDSGYFWTVSKSTSSGLLQIGYTNNPPVYSYPHMMGGIGTNIWTFLAQSLESGTITFTAKQGSRTVMSYSCPYTIASSSNMPSSLIVFKTGDAVPGGSSNDHFASYGNPAMNDYNQVAFKATVQNVSKYPEVFPLTRSASLPIPTNLPVTMSTNTWSGIWAQDKNGSLNLVARSALQLPDAGGFGSFTDPVYNNSNIVAFVAPYTPGFIYIPPSLPGSPPVFRGGLGVWISSNLRSPVAWVGQPAPGTQSAFRSFNQIALPDQGGVLILATLENNQQGIWAQDTAGNLKMIARQGGTLNVAGMNKTISSLSFMNGTNPISGQTRNFTQDTGNILYLATFADGSQVGVKVVFP